MPKWSEENKSKIGLPRPNAIIMGKKRPIPWQSAPNYESGKLELIRENEDKVLTEHRCAFCGDVINKKNTIRWIKAEEHKGRDIVPSDSQPFHLECMRQARIFCPFISQLDDKEYEINGN